MNLHLADWREAIGGVAILNGNQQRVKAAKRRDGQRRSGKRRRWMRRRWRRRRRRRSKEEHEKEAEEEEKEEEEKKEEEDEEEGTHLILLSALQWIRECGGKQPGRGGEKLREVLHASEQEVGAAQQMYDVWASSI